MGGWSSHFGPGTRKQKSFQASYPPSTRPWACSSLDFIGYAVQQSRKWCVMFCLCDLCRPIKFSPCRAKRASAWHAAAMEFSKVSSTRSCFKKCSDVVLWHTRVVWICLDRTFMKFDWPQWQRDGLASEHLSQSIAYRDSCQVDNCDVQERKVDLLPLHCPVDSYMVPLPELWSSENSSRPRACSYQCD